MIIETIYIWIIWLILKIPQLEIKETIDAEVYEEFAITNAKQKYSLFNSLLDNFESKQLPQFKVMQSLNYMIVDNSTIIEYDKEYFRVQYINNDNHSICQHKRNHTYMKELLLSFQIINFSNCSFSEKQQQYRLTNNDIKLSFTQCKDMKVIDQFNYLQRGQLIIIVCRIMTLVKVHILYQKNKEIDLIQLYDYQISLKELSNLLIRYQAHSSNRFILIINSKLMYFTSDQIYFYKIDLIDEIQFSEDGTKVYAMRKSVVYYVKLQNPKVQLVELIEQQNKVNNIKLLAFKCWKQGVLLLTDKGQLRYLEVDYKEQIHKITIYDGFGVIMIMLALFSIKINYF
ncbi:unnamed protein product [Paramecium pentaurelia]|uniref:Transmembrane protein n=1 Tax=Paramecium pentaurelia TaxID=43138 RepID=A0A8S1Y9J8_9CILI|nr:unnamed protein product [Paramecium pentaurelia]